ncbi:MAG: hypothetical protein ACK4TL_20095 [Hyphomicrobiaceae bacterium]
MIRILVLALIPLLLANQGGCTGPRPPVHVAVVTPATPPECVAPDVPEPRLADADIWDDEAARDRRALRNALRESNALRRICRAALESRNRRD